MFTPVNINREGLKKYGVTYSNVHLLRKEAEGSFPKRIRLSRFRVVWNREEIESWVEERARYSYRKGGGNE